MSTCQSGLHRAACYVFKILFCLAISPFLSQCEAFHCTASKVLSFGEMFHIKIFLRTQGFLRKTKSSHSLLLQLSLSWVTGSSCRHMCTDSQTQLLLCNSPPTRLQLSSRARLVFSPFLYLQASHAATAPLMFIYPSHFIFYFKEERTVDIF